MAGKVTRAIMRNWILKVCGELSEILAEEMNKTKKKRCWVRKWLSRREIYGASSTILRELAAEDVPEYTNWLRMSKEHFDILLAQITKKNTVMRSAIPARIKLEITLSYLATGNSYRTLQRLFRVSTPAISTFIPEVCDAIYGGLKEYIKVPESQEEWNVIEKGFRLKWNFPKCYGAIDGKHVTIHAPANCGSEFFNYKGTNSIILLALVDDNYCFSYINVGCPSRQSDGGVFQQSSLFEALENGLLPDGGFIVGDDAFALKTYSKVALSVNQKIFNYRLLRARRIVENAFGILVSRFRILEKPMACLPETVEKIINACCAIHNYLRITSHNTYTPSGSLDEEDIQSGQVRLGSWRIETNTPLPSIRTLGGNHSSRCARQLRDRLCQYFMGEGAVPWQERIIF